MEVNLTMGMMKLKVPSSYKVMGIEALDVFCCIVGQNWTEESFA